MIMILQPILHTSLVYMDDILLFSNTLEEHLNQLRRFHGLVKKYGIMLSTKKMTLARDEIEFIAMHFAPRAYSLGPHLPRAAQISRY